MDMLTLAIHNQRSALIEAQVAEGVENFKPYRRSVGLALSCLPDRLSALFHCSFRWPFSNPLGCFYTHGCWPRMARLIDSELSAAGQRHPCRTGPQMTLRLFNSAMSASMSAHIK